MEDPSISHHSANSGSPAVPTTDQPISIGDWMITLFLAAIPIIGFIMLLVWAFGDGSTPSKANWAKATLLWLVIIAAFYTLMFILFGAFFFTFFSA